MSDQREEKNLIKAFYEEQRRDALQALLGRDAVREELHSGLFQSGDILDGVKTMIPAGAALSSKIQQLLRALGAPAQCYCISSDPMIDGMYLDLRETLNKIVDTPSFCILSCIPGKLAYFQGKTDAERMLLKR